MRHELAQQEHPPARIEAEPRTPQLGEPMQWRLTAHHPAWARVTLADEDFISADPETRSEGADTSLSWFVLRGPEKLTVPPAEGIGLARTTWTWTVLGLEPGEWQVPAPVLLDAAGEPLTVEVDTVEVSGELAENEDVPRALPGFHEPPPAVAPIQVGPAVGALLLALLLVILVLRMRSKRPAPVVVVRPLDRLDEVERSWQASERADARGLYFELTRLAREATDAVAGPEPVGPQLITVAQSDEEWLAQVSEHLAVEDREALAELLQAAQAVKYGFAQPTPFAVDHCLADVRALLARLERAATTAGSVDAARDAHGETA